MSQSKKGVTNKEISKRKTITFNNGCRSGLLDRRESRELNRTSESGNQDVYRVEINKTEETDLFNYEDTVKENRLSGEMPALLTGLILDHVTAVYEDIFILPA